MYALSLTAWMGSPPMPDISSTIAQTHTSSMRAAFPAQQAGSTRTVEYEIK
jgi:hypothetical protein